MSEIQETGKKALWRQIAIDLAGIYLKDCLAEEGYPSQEQVINDIDGLFLLLEDEAIESIQDWNEAIPCGQNKGVYLCDFVYGYFDEYWGTRFWLLKDADRKKLDLLERCANALELRSRLEGKDIRRADRLSQELERIRDTYGEEAFERRVSPAEYGFRGAMSFLFPGCCPNILITGKDLEGLRQYIPADWSKFSSDGVVII